MKKEITKKLMCIQIRSGIEIWVEDEKIAKLKAILAQNTGSKFIDFENQLINTADIVGVFDAKTMDEVVRRKNGQWRCKRGNWHDRFEKCSCDMVPSKFEEEPEENEKPMRDMKDRLKKEFPKQYRAMYGGGDNY